MQCKGEFVFKSLEKRDAGTFKNSAGQDINYDMAYVLKVDESTYNGIFERKLKVDKENTTLLNKVKNLKPYDKIFLICDIVMYGSNARVVPIDLDSNNKSKSQKGGYLLWKVRL